LAIPTLAVPHSGRRHVADPLGVVIGGSTVLGFPYPPELAFPRHLELVLKSQQPNREIEVLNAGITAVNSVAEADVLEQALKCDPDVIVVYTGHRSKRFTTCVQRAFRRSACPDG
jgi:ABC-type uncharacterized transport system substrate-binding protein